MASREIPACLARVAPVCLSLCGEAGANSGCRSSNCISFYSLDSLYGEED